MGWFLRRSVLISTWLYLVDMNLWRHSCRSKYVVTLGRLEPGNSLAFFTTLVALQKTVPFWIICLSSSKGSRGKSEMFSVWRHFCGPAVLSPVCQCDLNVTMGDRRVSMLGSSYRRSSTGVDMLWHVLRIPLSRSYYTQKSWLKTDETWWNYPLVMTNIAMEAIQKSTI